MSCWSARSRARSGARETPAPRDGPTVAVELGVDVLDGIVRLAEQSLLMRVDDAVGGVRFAWLETIRDHALERLVASGEARELRDRHTRAFADLAMEVIRHIPGADQAWWIDRLEADAANLRTAMLHALEVAVPFRRRGLGRHVMRAASFWAIGQGADSFAVLVTNANEAANPLYAGLGMTPVSGYHYRIREDA